MASGAPIDGFGVGTSMGVSEDAPTLDLAYKLCEYAGQGRLKLSTGKPVLPGHKQVFRVEQDDMDVRDVIARADENLHGRPLLAAMMRDGRRLSSGMVDLGTVREYAREQLARLPAPIRGLAEAETPYPVAVSQALVDFQTKVREEEEIARRGRDIAQDQRREQEGI